MVALRRPSEEDATERLKGDLVERLGLGVVAQFAAGSDISRARRELSVTCRAILNTAAYADVALDDRERLVRRTLDDICGLGPLQELLEDEEVSEVVVNGTRGLFFEKHGRLQAAQAVFESHGATTAASRPVTVATGTGGTASALTGTAQVLTRGWKIGRAHV